MNIAGYTVEYITYKENENGQKRFYKEFDDEKQAKRYLDALRAHKGVKLAYLLVKTLKSD